MDKFKKKSLNLNNKLKLKSALSNLFIFRCFKLFSIITSLILITYIIDAINLPGYGFDLTDQSLYVLEAKKNSDYLGWGFGYGWFTSLVFYLSNSDIEQFRANFSYLLFLLNFWLSYRFFKTFDSLNLVSSRFVKICVILIGSTSFNLVLLPINKTPGYNIINFISILIAIIAVTYLLPRNNSKSSLAISNILISISYLFGITSKPSTPFFLFVFINFVCLFFYNQRRVLMNILWQIIGFITLIVLLILIGKLPLNYFEQFSSKLKMTPITDESSINHALKGLILWPYRILSDFLFINKLALLFLFISFFLILRYQTQQRFLLPSALSFFLFFALSITFKPDLKISFVVQYDRSQHTITLFSWLAFFIYLLLLTIFYSKNKRIVRPQRVEVNFIISVFIILLGISILVFGFGSNNGLVIMGVMCISFVIYMCIFLVLKISDLRIKKFLLAITLLMTVYASFIDHLGRKNFNYRGEYFSSTEIKNYQMVFVSPDRRNQLKVSPILKNQIENMHSEILSTNIFQPGSDLINIVYPWAPGYSIILGSNNPPSTLLTIFGYEHSLRLMEELLNSVNKDYDFQNAFLLKSNFNSLDSYGIAQSNLALSLIQIKSGLIFPKDYSVVYVDSLIELYKPKYVINQE